MLENQERDQRNQVGQDTDSWGRRIPPPNPPAQGGGSPTRTPPPQAHLPPLNRREGAPPLDPPLITTNLSRLPPPPFFCTGIGEALQNSHLHHHHHAVVLLGFRGEIYYLYYSLEQGEEGLLRLRTCDRLRKRCRNAASEGSSTRS